MYMCLHVDMCTYWYLSIDVDRYHLHLARWQCLVIKITCVSNKFFCNARMGHATRICHGRHIHQDTSTHPRQITVDMTLFHVCIYWVSHVTRKNESCHTYKWLMSRITTSQVMPRAHINTPFIYRNRHTSMHLRQIRVHITLSCMCILDESCHAFERKTWHSKCMDESCQKYEWVMSHNVHTSTHLSYIWINTHQSFMSLYI